MIGKILTVKNSIIVVIIFFIFTLFFPENQFEILIAALTAIIIGIIVCAAWESFKFLFWFGIILLFFNYFGFPIISEILLCVTDALSYLNDILKNNILKFVS